MRQGLFLFKYSFYGAVLYPYIGVILHDRTGFFKWQIP